MAGGRDVTLRLPNGTEVQTFAAFAAFGSPALRALFERAHEQGDAVVNVPLDVSRAGFLLALDELLPVYLRTSRHIEAFNPFKKTHRDFIASVRYLQLPHASSIEESLPVDPHPTQVNRDGVLFINENPGRLTEPALFSIFELRENTVSFSTPAAVELLRVCSGDDTATRAFMLAAGRAVFLAMERSTSLHQ